MHLHAEFLHVKPGKGAAFVRTKLKNYLTGNVLERTFRAGESAVQAVLEKRDCQYTYQDGDEVRMRLLFRMGYFLFRYASSAS
jgi:translation elongation factor P/translation initiation factor 5A